MSSEIVKVYAFEEYSLLKKPSLIASNYSTHNPEVRTANQRSCCYHGNKNHIKRAQQQLQMVLYIKSVTCTWINDVTLFLG